MTSGIIYFSWFSNSSVIRQKGESQNVSFKKTKHVKFSEKRTFLSYQRVRNVLFSDNLTCFVCLKHLFWGSPFCLITDELLPYYRKINWYICFFPFQIFAMSMTITSHRRNEKYLTLLFRMNHCAETFTVNKTVIFSWD